MYVKISRLDLLKKEIDRRKNYNPLCTLFSRSFVQNNSFIFRALKVPVDIVEKCKQTAAALFLSSFFEEKAREILNLSDLKKTSSSP